LGRKNLVGQQQKQIWQNAFQLCSGNMFALAERYQSLSGVEAFALKVSGRAFGDLLLFWQK
jgi:hypothetical protein